LSVDYLLLLLLYPCILAVRHYLFFYLFLFRGLTVPAFAHSAFSVCAYLRMLLAPTPWRFALRKLAFVVFLFVCLVGLCVVAVGFFFFISRIVSHPFEMIHFSLLAPILALGLFFLVGLVGSFARLLVVE